MPRCLLVVVLVSVGAPKPPREAALEELLETADGWLYQFDEDEDGRLSKDEMEPLLEQLRSISSMDIGASAKLDTTMFMGMADGDKDGLATRAELVELLKRMKGYDGGHVERGDAATPSSGIESVGDGYGESHEQRIRKKKKRKKVVKDET